METKPYGYIYKITVNNPESTFDNCYYIGQSKYTQHRKPYQYWGSSVYLAQYRKKYHTFGLDKQILCECITKEELDQKEIEYISDLYLTDAFVDGGRCLNLQAGGPNSKRGKEVKRKIAKNNKTSLWQKNSTPWNKGMKYTDKQKQNIIKANRAKPTYGHLGKKHSEKTKQKISEIQKDWVWWTNGTKEKHCKECPGKDFVRGRLKYKKRKV